MKLASYVANGKPAFGVVIGDGVATMNDRLGGRYATLRDVIAAGALDELHRAAQGAQSDQKLAGLRFLPVIHSGSFIGPEVPVWDIADRFGDTNLLVTNIEQGRDLATCLGGNSVALMRGHGFASAARSLIEVVRLSVYLPRNARALMRARQLGGGDQVPVARRDRGPQSGLQPLFGRDLAHLGILGEQGRLRPPADPS